MRSPDHVQLVIVHGEPLFFSQRDSPWLPTLRLLHQYPQMMQRVQADTGAVKFVLQGANIMCPGLTSPGADMPVEVRSSTLAACLLVYARRLPLQTALYAS